MKAVLTLAVLMGLAGCGGKKVYSGVDVTISYKAQTWRACSLNVWHPWNGERESDRLQFTDDKGKEHELVGNYKIDYSTIPCFD